MAERSQSSVNDQSEWSEALRPFVERVRTQFGIPGIAVGLLVDGQRHVVTCGVGNVETGSPVRADTLFQVGSISKTFTAALILILVQEGQIALEDTVAQHLEDLSSASPELLLNEVTIAQLLSHTSGFDGDHFLINRKGTNVEALAGARQLFAPGTGYSYSNAAFSLLGAIVESVVGLAFHEAMRTRLLVPLGLTGAAYRADDVITRDVAAPHWVFGEDAYVIRGAGWQPGWELGPIDFAPGGLAASISHLLTWAQCNLDGRDERGAPLLFPESLRTLQSPVVKANGSTHIAHDWFVDQVNDTTVIGHGGATAGYLSDLTIVPSAPLAVAVLTNATNGSKAIHAIRRWTLEHVAGLSERDLVPNPQLVPSAQAIVGQYLHAFGVLTVHAGTQPGEFVITTVQRDDVAWQPPADPPVTVAFVDDATVIGVAEGPKPKGTFGFDADGRACWLNWHERRALRID